MNANLKPQVKLDYSLVPHGSIMFWMAGMIDYLRKSEKWTRGRASIDDIVKFVLTGQMNLWVTYNPENMVPYGFIITEVKQYPQCKMLVLQYAAGEPNHMEGFDKDGAWHDLLDDFARDADCAGIEMFGRPGWGKHLKKYGYDVQTVVYERYLGDYNG